LSLTKFCCIFTMLVQGRETLFYKSSNLYRICTALERGLWTSGENRCSFHVHVYGRAVDGDLSLHWVCTGPSRVKAERGKTFSRGPSGEKIFDFFKWRILVYFVIFERRRPGVTYGPSTPPSRRACVCALVSGWLRGYCPFVVWRLDCRTRGREERHRALSWLRSDASSDVCGLEMAWCQSELQRRWCQRWSHGLRQTLWCTSTFIFC